MRVCKKMVIYFGIKTPQSEKERKYTFTIYVRVFLPAGMIASVHGKKPHVYRVIIFETNGRPYQRSYYVIRRVTMALSQMLHEVNYKARRRYDWKSFGSVCKASYVPNNRTFVVKGFFGEGDANLNNVSVFPVFKCG